MQSLARGEWRDAGTDAADNPDALLARLRPMAWRLFSREAGVNRFSHDTLLRPLNAASSSADAKADAVLNQLCYLGFLEGSGYSQDEAQYQFRHTTFLEFLAAAHLAAEINAEGWAQAKVSYWNSENGWQPIKISEILDINAFEPSWEPLFTFTSGLLMQPKPLLEMLAARGKDDHYRHRLMLLYRCCGALATSKEDGLEAVLETALRELQIWGLTTVMRMPEMRKQWLANVKVIANLPKTGGQLTGILVTVARHHSKTHIGGAEEILDALSHPASKKGAENCLTAILALCIEPDVHIRGYETAEKLVTIATQFGLPDFLRQTIAVIEGARGRPWLQVTLARSLLRCEQTDVADRGVDVLVAIAGNQQLDESPRWDAAVALIHGLRGCRAERIHSELCRMLLAKHSDETSKKVQQTMARWILPAVVPSVTDSRSAVLALAIKRHLGSAYFEAETHWASDLVQNEDTAVRQIGLRHLTGRIKSGDHEDYTISFLVSSVLRADHDADRKVVAELLRSRLTRPIANGMSHLAAIQGLMELGEPYDQRLRHEMFRLADSPTIGTYALEELANEAKSHDDAALFNRIAIRFADSDRNHDQASESGSDDRRRAAKLLFGTPEWEPLERNAFARLRGHTGENREDWFSVNAVCFGAKSSSLIKLTEDLLSVGKWNFHPWVPLMRELALRGWRFRISRRKVVTLRRGQEEPRADAEFRY